MMLLESGPHPCHPACRTGKIIYTPCESTTNLLRKYYEYLRNPQHQTSLIISRIDNMQIKKLAPVRFVFTNENISQSETGGQENHD